MRLFQFTLIASVLILSACDYASTNDSSPLEQIQPDTQLTLNYEKFTLDNGLDVVLHVDTSDPVVAINLAAHVGSAREVSGRTGFAHLFEHLLFLDSENLGYGGLDEMNTRIGGEGTNGFTTHDMTQYFQAVPKDGLEKIIWAEADKLGWFIQTVSQDVIDNEKQVVKNEKRQRVDNQPYGHNFYIINKALYPEDHPYNWQVIGSLADLDAGNLQDVKDFFNKWYVPNNVTVTLSGDFDPATAKHLVEKYFGEIPMGDPITPYTPRAGVLEQNIDLYHEDNFATVPRLTYVWPTVEQYHPDSYALDILIDFLTTGKRAPLNAVLIDEQKLTSSVSGFHYTKEISGEVYILVSSNAGEDLDALVPAIETAFERFEAEGISQSDLDRIRAGIEVEFYSNVQSALGKAIQLSEYNLFTDNPGFYETEIAAIQSVTPADIMRVYETYIKDKPRISTSFVPQDQVELALNGSEQADVVEEVVVPGEGAPVDFDPAARIIATPNPSSFDRTIEPAFGPAYDLPAPDVWRTKLSNGIDIVGIESTETPLIAYSLFIDAGDNRGSYALPAVPEMTADLLTKGTATKTTSELEDAIKALGSTLTITTNQNGAYVRGQTLARNFTATMALVEEILLEPRWDAEEFDLLKRRFLNDVDQFAANPNAIAVREMAKLRYPEGHIFYYGLRGPKAKIEAITLDDLKAFHAQNYTQNGAVLRLAGAISEDEAAQSFTRLQDEWTKPAQAPLDIAPMMPVDNSQLYVYNVPSAKQSVLRIERPALDATSAELPLANALNFPLGGIYTSILNTELRVNRGYTYGIRSGFSAQADRGTFGVSTSVRTNVTLESLELIRDILNNYGPEFTKDDLIDLKDALLRGQALKSETLSDKLDIVEDITQYGYADDYTAKNAQAVANMTLEDVKSLADAHLRPDAMRYLVVGDAQTQAERLNELGFGEPIILPQVTD